MFHQGDLQSGISTAIQQQKLVTCFIHDEDDDSSRWETELLPEISNLLQQKTVLLKMKLGSQEAGFLSAFCPMTTAPSIAVIDNGKVVVKLEPETTTEEWLEKMQAALHVRDASQASAAPSTSQASATSASTRQASLSSTPPAVTAPPSTAEDAQSSLSTLMPGRAARLEADQAAKQAAEKAERVARAEARRKELEAAEAAAKRQGKQPEDSSSTLAPKARRDWVREQAKRKQEAKAERERILKRIQSDREDQKARLTMMKEASAYAAPEALKSAEKTHVTRSTTCSLQIRLVDGSSIKHQFESGQTLKDVRAWIKEAATPDTVSPSFTFKQSLAPLPSKTIDGADEDRSLWMSGLTPSATLILVPVEERAPATASGFLGILVRVLTTLFGIIATLLSSVTGGRRPVEEPVAQNAPESTIRASGVDTAPKARQRHKTLADARAEEKNDGSPAEFYNGNSSAFEGRKEDDNDS